MRLSAARDWDNYLYFYVMNIFLFDTDSSEIRSSRKVVRIGLRELRVRSPEGFVHSKAAYLIAALIWRASGTRRPHLFRARPVSPNAALTVSGDSLSSAEGRPVSVSIRWDLPPKVSPDASFTAWVSGVSSA